MRGLSQHVVLRSFLPPRCDYQHPKKACARARAGKGENRRSRNGNPSVEHGDGPVRNVFDRLLMWLQMNNNTISRFRLLCCEWTYVDVPRCVACNERTQKHRRERSAQQWLNFTASTMLLPGSIAI